MTISIDTILSALSKEYSISSKTAQNIITLFEEGATVPFVARYRKEVTGDMSDERIRSFHDRLRYLEELEKRRESIIEQLKGNRDIPITLLHALRKAATKSELEDLYAPFKKSRKTKADLAEESGLLDFAVFLWQEGQKQAEKQFANFQASLNTAMSLPEAIAGAGEIILERLAKNVATIQHSKQLLRRGGLLTSRVMRGKKEQGEKYQDYFEYQEPIKKCPPHRLLALFRGKKESILKLSIVLEGEFPVSLNGNDYLTPFGFPALKERTPSKEKQNWLVKAWQEKILAKVESDLLNELKEFAEEGAIDVFQANLKDLLMAAPAGAKRTIGLDPGFKNGVKWAAIDEYGQLLDYGVVYPHAPLNKNAEAASVLVKVIKRHKIEWAVIGNGTASRETEVFIKKLIFDDQLACRSVIVSEAGASVYSASPIAIQEFPDLDVTIRGAISIARRFQDPLAELVKIDPQAIGVGQYQHDLKSNRLSDALKSVVEDCVNAVGVDVNLASVALLTYVSGLSERLAQHIVTLRDQLGGFKNRNQLKQVKGIGDKAFEQCAGFLRIRNGDEPLDASAVHPESYALVKELARSVKLELSNLIGNPSAQGLLKTAAVEAHQSYTVQDIIQELAKPGRDPRPEFKYARFDDTVEKIEDLDEDMILEGVVTNVAAFGAFVDIGVHQDGLIHISQLADRFVKDPRDEVRVGEVVKVKVLEVDAKRKRIGLKRLS
ncbi:helix-hairpin-helix domain-containing protein [Marinomonas ostreistagni]|uniref:RNA-binding transcriptional accessory protein n=1 Tax=Marinomonas ostreistagni TaxID=359209 RepID=A0ABS0ZCU6_9GAMM|nr:Tex family protein [Marinomonas ostreistagni]MBJ7551465.1 RNA-binding transcriptional accessory protein [Marinomonas ostreistagni]